MLELTVRQILEATGGKLTNGNILDNKVDAIITDSRKVTKGCLFICLEGEKFDGHSFAHEALSKGAVAVVAHKKIDGNESIIEVSNTLTALGDIAKYYRVFYETKLNKPLIVVGVTGSVGKTGTKDFVYEILRRKYKTLKSKLNFNNEIGLPLTILDLHDEEALVVEMGMRGLKQIEYLSNIAKPTHGIITNIGSSHIELLGSKENILKAKSEIICGMTGKKVLVLNGDDEYLKDATFPSDINIVYFGLKEHNQIKGTIINNDTKGIYFLLEGLNNVKYSVELKLLGKHNVYNSLAAIAVSVNCGVDIEDCIKACENYAGDTIRQNIFRIEEKNITIIDDTYNASIESMKAAIDVLSSFKNAKRKIAVLGDMLELGDLSKEGHTEVGKYAVKAGIDIVIATGNEARYIAETVMESTITNESQKICIAYYTQNAFEAAKRLLLMAEEGDCILVKGSHAMKMGTVVDAIKEREVGI